MFVFYRFCREVDDIADDRKKGEGEKRSLLYAWEEAAAGRQVFPQELEEVLGRKRVPREYLGAIIEGVGGDISRRRFSSWEELRGYCWKVAVAVGLASNRIMGVREVSMEGADRYAERLGMALQLTNILRDVAEDAGVGRIYLPKDLMRKHLLEEEEVLSGRGGEKLVRVLGEMGERVEWYFGEAEKELPREEAGRGLRAAEVMREIYFVLFAKMKVDGYRVFEKRYRVGMLRKLWAVARRGRH